MRGLRDTHLLIQGGESMAPGSAHFLSHSCQQASFCDRKNSHGDREAKTWPAQTFTLWTPAQTVRHSLLSWGRSLSPTPTVPSIQRLPAGEAYHSSWLNRAPSTLEQLTTLFCDKKQQIRFVSLMDFEAHCLQMDPAFFFLKQCRNLFFLL